MDSNLLVKNTFIDFQDEDEDSALPRAFSDQSHSRKPPPAELRQFSIIHPIAEEGSEELSDRTSSIAAVDAGMLHTVRTISRPDNHLYYAKGMEEVGGMPIPSLMFSMNSVIPGPIDDCRWHSESASMGDLAECGKRFTKLEFDGRLSMVTNDCVFETGTHRFLVLIESDLSVADGFGFVFSTSLPCKKNIQKIDSIFISQKGKICSRLHNEMEILNNRSIGNIENGSILELQVNLQNLDATFTIYSPPLNIDTNTCSLLVRDYHCLSTWASGTATCSIKHLVEQTQQAGYFCAVIKNKHTQIRFL